MTVTEVAKALRISRNGAYDAVREGTIPAIRFGRVLRVPRAAFLRLVEGADGPLRTA
jgi:excisionase family DNA binding protein